MSARLLPATCSACEIRPVKPDISTLSPLLEVLRLVPLFVPEVVDCVWLARPVCAGTELPKDVLSLILMLLHQRARCGRLSLQEQVSGHPKATSVYHRKIAKNSGKWAISA